MTEAVNEDPSNKPLRSGQRGTYGVRNRCSGPPRWRTRGNAWVLWARLKGEMENEAAGREGDSRPWSHVVDPARFYLQHPSRN